MIGWGRTDAGVHAKGAVVTVDLWGKEVMELLARRRGGGGKMKKKKNGGKVLKDATTMSNGHDSGEDDNDQTTVVDVDAAATFLLSVLKQFACNTGATATSSHEYSTRYASVSAFSVTPVPLTFDARYSAKWNRYIYYICSGINNGETVQPFVWSRYAWLIRESLDYEGMVDAAKMLSGEEHNYEWMCVIQEGELRNTRRTVHLNIETVPVKVNGNDTMVPYFLQQNENSVVYKVVATSDFFLYKMVRRIVGLLVAIGKKQADLTTLKRCIGVYDKYGAASVDRDGERMKIPVKLLETAPAKGLCLDHIEYDIPI